ncbi:hypothetical protein ACFY5F_50895 [Streptomyces sp. NPDC013161]|uniref:hypothetical protein n=1 Tax=Streptomyces sp. NPDC013161 TaxID=3364862 RepID=UPI003686D573
MRDGIQTPEQAALAGELAKLENKALRGGKSWAQAIKSANANAPQVKPLTRTTVSDWVTGKTPPKDFDRLWALVAVLREWAGAPSEATKAGRDARAAAQASWKVLWQRAQPGRKSADDVTPQRGAGRPGVRIADADPIRYLEVHPAIEVTHPANGSQADPLPAYVEREHDQLLSAEVDQAQHHNRLVVLVGDSSTGKTRALWEALQRLPAGWQVWRPADRASLLDRLQRQQSQARTVLWLNELQRFLYTPHTPEQGERAAAALTDLLHTPGRGPTLIVGTLWRDPLTTLSAVSGHGDPHQTARALLHSGTVIPVAEDFNEAALTDVRRLAAHDARLSEALEKGGTRITQYLAGAQKLLKSYARAPVEALAVLDTAADARRLGSVELVPEEFLYAAAAAYLHPDHWRTQDDSWRATWFTRALSYTSQPCHGIPGPLSRELPLPGGQAIALPVCRLADYLAQDLARARRHKVPPAEFWSAAADHLHKPEDLFELAQAARFRLRLRQADLLYRRAADAGHTQALDLLAYMRNRIGDRQGAEDVTWEAADHADGGELYNLTCLRAEAEDWESAERLAWRAADAGWPSALSHLVTMRIRWGLEDMDSIERLIRGAADAGDSQALEWLRWGELRETAQRLISMERRYDGGLSWPADPAVAEAWAQRMTESGDTGLLAALVESGERHGNPEVAERMAFRGAESGAPFALYRLARLRRKAGDRNSAKRLFRATATFMESAEFPAESLLTTCWLKESEGEPEEAKRLAGQAADAGQAEGLYDLAELLQDSWAEQLCRYGLEADGTIAEAWWGPEAAEGTGPGRI